MSTNKWTTPTPTYYYDNPDTSSFFDERVSCLEGVCVLSGEGRFRSILLCTIHQKLRSILSYYRWNYRVNKQMNNTNRKKQEKPNTCTSKETAYTEIQLINTVKQALEFADHVWRLISSANVPKAEHRIINLFAWLMACLLVCRVVCLLVHVCCHAFLFLLRDNKKAFLFLLRDNKQTKKAVHKLNRTNTDIFD